jgi:hypothetical protein
MPIYPPSTSADARNRALRTFVQGLLFDVVLAVSVTLAAAIAAPDFVWSGTYWTALGLTLAKTGIMSATAYVARTMAPPNP